MTDDSTPPETPDPASAEEAKAATSPVRRWLLATTGWGFVILGVAGLFLPFLQGILFLVIGLIVLSRQSPWAARQLERFRATHPAVDRSYVEALRRWHHLRTWLTWWRHD